MSYIVLWVLHIALCIWVAKMAEEAGKSFWFYFLVSFFTSALVGWLMYKFS